LKAAGEIFSAPIVLRNEKTPGKFHQENSKGAALRVFIGRSKGLKEVVSELTIGLIGIALLSSRIQ